VAPGQSQSTTPLDSQVVLDQFGYGAARILLKTALKRDRSVPEAKQAVDLTGTVEQGFQILSQSTEV
jgi:hypothetical protein